MNGQPEYNSQLKEYKTVFIFQEPLTRTNIQQAELISLIELQQPNVLFEFSGIDDIQEKYTGSEGGFLTFEKDILERTPRYNVVHILFFEQSAVVYSNFELDIIEMIRRSGYIHSAGDLLFISKWESLENKKITETITNYCLIHKQNFPLHFYTKSSNKEHVEKMNNLLIDDLRYHLGISSFKQAAETIKKDIDNQLLRQRVEKIGNVNIFIYKDSAKSKDLSTLSDLYDGRNIIEYAVCYLSRYKKDNPLHAIDDLRESKPFWAGIYTTPHQLMNAMLNLAKVKKESVIIDPFCYTGTLAIEASQIGCKIICADIAQVKGAEDNYKFLCSGADNFLSITNELKEIAVNKTNLHADFNDLASQSAKLNKHGLPEIEESMHIEKILDKFKNKESDLNIFPNRIYFHIVRRYHLERKRQFIEEKDSSALVLKYVGNKSPGGKNNPVSPQAGYFLFGDQLKSFEEEFEKINKPVVSSRHPEFNNLFLDNYYLTERVGYVNYSQNEPHFITKDIKCDFSDYGIAENFVDAVVTDPPYGYGEELGKDEIESIYENFFEKSFRWLKPKGYVVFCALDKARTGRKEGLLFTEDILKIANKIAKSLGIEFIISSIYPIEKGVRSIYYWKSKYALNRSIIALKILK